MAKLTGNTFAKIFRQLGAKKYIKTVDGEKGFNFVIRNGQIFVWGAYGDVETARIDNTEIEAQGFIDHLNMRLFRLIKSGEIELQTPDLKTLIIIEKYGTGFVRSTVRLTYILDGICMGHTEISRLGSDGFTPYCMQAYNLDENETANGGDDPTPAVEPSEEPAEDETQEIEVEKSPEVDIIIEESIKEPAVILTEKDLDQKSFEGQNVSGSQLAGTDIVEKDFYRAILDGSNFSESYLSDVNMDDASINGCNFNDCDMKYIYWSKSKGVASFAMDSDMTHAIANDVCFTRWNFSRAKMDKSYFKRSNLRYCNFTGASLKYANFDGADLRYCKFDGADLTGATFKGAQLSGASFQRATLYETDFIGSTFNLTMFNGAKMIFTHLQHCKINSVILKDAFIRCAEFDRSIINNTGIDDADIAHVSMRRVTFKNMSIAPEQLRGFADIFEAKFPG